MDNSGAKIDNPCFNSRALQNIHLVIRCSYVTYVIPLNMTGKIMILLIYITNYDK